MDRCLFCYKPLVDGQVDFHPQCAKKFFGTTTVPIIEYGRDELDDLAAKIIQSQTSLTGVQPKLSLNLHKHERGCRLTIVGLWGDFILKPQTDAYPKLPENEDLTMHLAEAARIQTVPHTLIHLADGSLGYITRRIDRSKNGEKIDMEDLCQLTLHPTEYKYKSSYEQIGKTIALYSATPKLDLVNYIQLLLFCFVTGNNDMHLKNFSLYRPKTKYVLTPAYDLLNVTIANPRDKEELALTLNGKKSSIKLSDFLKTAATLGIEEKILLQLIENMRMVMPKWEKLINDSFLDEKLKLKYIELIEQRLKSLADKAN